MKLNHPMLRNAVGLMSAFAARLWRQSVDWRAVYFDPTVDTVHPRFSGRYVYVGWHEYMLMPIVLRGDRSMLALASGHADGDVVSRAMGHLGWGVVRGSTTRGAASAVLRLLRDDVRHPNLTPDGPRGPRRHFSQGPIFLASRLGLPLVCVGYGYDRPWRLRSWDRFAIPRPFSRARAVFGPPLRLPPQLSRQGIEDYRLWFEQLLQWLTAGAEAWATSGRHTVGELAMLPGEAPPPMLRPSAHTALALPELLAQSWAALGDHSALPDTKAG